MHPLEGQQRSLELDICVHTPIGSESSTRGSSFSTPSEIPENGPHSNIWQYLQYLLEGAGGVMHSSKANLFCTVATDARGIWRKKWFTQEITSVHPARILGTCWTCIWVVWRDKDGCMLSFSILAKSTDPLKQNQRYFLDVIYRKGFILVPRNNSFLAVRKIWFCFSPNNLSAICAASEKQRQSSLLKMESVVLLRINNIHACPAEMWLLLWLLVLQHVKIFI